MVRNTRQSMVKLKTQAVLIKSAQVASFSSSYGPPCARAMAAANSTAAFCSSIATSSRSCPDACSGSGSPTVQGTRPGGKNQSNPATLGGA